jgi:ubiquitin carboxyl-terminal hydrolase 10
LSDASQQVLVEVLPPILALHLRRFQHDVAAGGVIKIDKSIQFDSELKIPPGAIFIFLLPWGYQG